MMTVTKCLPGQASPRPAVVQTPYSHRREFGPSLHLTMCCTSFTTSHSRAPITSTTPSIGSKLFPTPDIVWWRSQDGQEDKNNISCHTPIVPDWWYGPILWSFLWYFMGGDLFRGLLGLRGGGVQGVYWGLFLWVYLCVFCKVFWVFFFKLGSLWW